MLLLSLADKTPPVWAASRKFSSAAALAERLSAKLHIAHVPLGALVAFDGKPNDAIVDFVGNLVSVLDAQSAPQCGIKRTKAGMIAAFLWRNQADLHELQASAQEDPAYGPGVLPLALLGQRWAAIAPQDRPEASRLRGLLPGIGSADARQASPTKSASGGSGTTAERRLARAKKIGQAPESVDRGEQRASVDDVGATASAELQALMRSISAKLPAEFPARQATLLRLTDTFREELAAALQAPLNAHLASMPQENYEEKQALVLWLNAELRRFGLAVRCPKTGRASLLQVDIGRQPEKGRFQTDNVNGQGKRERPLSFNELIPLELMPDDLSRASWGKWAGHSQAAAERRPGRRHR